MQNRPMLQQLLDQNHRFALNGRGTTNHLPMALTALAKMGASDTRLSAYFSYWEEKFALPAVSAATSITNEDWQARRHELLGGGEFAALQSYFHTRINTDGADTVITQVLQTIPFAPASGAFHALIRLAYGLEAAHHGEIAAGLAYLTAANFDLNAALNLPGGYAGLPLAESPEQSFARIAQAINGSQYPGQWIVQQLQGVAADPRFTANLSRLAVTGKTLSDIARIAISAYWQTQHFTVLHIVTGCHAARVVLSRIASHLPAGLTVESAAQLISNLLQDFWLAACAAYASAGAPPLEAHAADAPALPPDSDWIGLLAQAVTKQNDHIIKFCYSAWQESKIYASPLYYAAAKRLVQRQSGQA